MSTPRCWAFALGGCSGSLTGEHVLSKSLLGDSVSVRGMSWCRDEFKTIGAAGLTVKNLCTAHNNALSPCDQEARQLADLMDWMMSDFLPPDGPDRVERLNGHLFARWLCKTACNIAAASKRLPPTPFVRYAFSAVDEPSVHIYATTQAADRIRLNSAHHTIQWLQHKTDPDGAVVVFLFRGMAWIIGTHPIETVAGHANDLLRSLDISVSAYVSRPTGMEVVKPMPGMGARAAGTIVLHW